MPNLLPNTLDVNIVRLYKALFDQAPGYTFLSAYRELGTVAAVSAQLNAQFNSLSNAQWAARIADNLHLTGGARDGAIAYLIIVQNSAPAGRTVQQHRADQLPGLLLGYATFYESIDGYREQALYFNNSIATAYQYSINPANNSIDPAVLSLADEPNTPPVVGNDTATATEGGATIAGNLAANDSDAQGDPLSYSLAANQVPVPGLTLNANGGFLFDPTGSAYDAIRAGQSQTIVVNYRVSDGQGGTTPGTLTLTVNGTNDAPVAQDVSAAVLEDGTVAITPMSSDIDSGDTATYSIVANPLKGTVSFANGQFTYTPNANYAGNDSFTYRVTDASGATSTAVANILVAPVNDAPVGANSSVSGLEDSSVGGTVTAADVDGDTLSYAVSAGPANGSVTMATDGSFIYTPNANFNGTDTFTYVASDGLLSSAARTVTITIAKANDAPVAVAVAASGAEDGGAIAVTLASSDVDRGDSPSTETTTYSIVNNPVNGTISGFNAATGTFNYTPNADFNGTDTVVFRVTDAAGASSTAVATITVTSVNDAPVGVASAASGLEDTSIGGSVTATDVDNASLSYSVATGPSNGSVTMTAGGNYVYTPNANFNGTDTFTYVASDGQLSSTPRTVTVTVGRVNDAPVALNVSATGAEDGGAIAVAGASTDVDRNDTTLPAETATYAIVSQPANGTVTVTNAATGAFSYTPNGNFNGTDTFAYRVTDASGATSVAVATVTVTAVNDAPVANALSLTTFEDQAVTGQVTGTDVDNNPLTFSATTQPSNGTVSMSPDGSFTYTPNANYNGTDSFTYTVRDSAGATATQTVTLTVNAVDDVLTPGLDNLVLTASAETVRGFNNNLNAGDRIDGGTSAAAGAQPEDKLIHNVDGSVGSRSFASFILNNVETLEVTNDSRTGMLTAAGAAVSYDLSSSNGLTTARSVNSTADVFFNFANLSTNLEVRNLTDGTSVGIDYRNDDVTGAADSANVLITDSDDDGLDAETVTVGGPNGADTNSGVEIINLTTQPENASGPSNVRVNDFNTPGAHTLNVMATSALVIGDTDQNLGAFENALSTSVTTVNAGTSTAGVALSTEASVSAATITGGRGSDTFATSDVFSDIVNAGPGNDTVRAGGGNNTVSGGEDNDSITAGAGHDSVTGDAGNDTVNAGNGNNIVSGGEGNDSLTTGSGNDVVRGDSGDDVIAAGDGTNDVDGGTGNDAIVSGGGSDLLVGGEGNDTITTGAGFDSVSGGDGDDVVNAGSNLTSAFTETLDDADSGGDTVDGGGHVTGDTLNVNSDNADGNVFDRVTRFERIVVANSTMTVGEDDVSVPFTVSVTDSSPFDMDTGTSTVVDATAMQASFQFFGNDLDPNNPDPDQNGSPGAIGGAAGGIDDDFLSRSITVLGGSANDTVMTGIGNDSVAGNGGNDSIYTHSGNDSVSPGTGVDNVDLSAGDDEATVWGRDNDLDGDDEGDDDLQANDTIAGGTGNDTTRLVAPARISTDTIPDSIDATLGAGFTGMQTLRVIDEENRDNNNTVTVTATTAYTNLEPGGSLIRSVLAIDGSELDAGETLRVFTRDLDADGDGVDEDFNITGGGGNDQFWMGDNLDSGDTIAGGAGDDTLAFRNVLIDDDLTNVTSLETVVYEDSGARSATLGARATAAGVATVLGSANVDTLDATAMTSSLSVLGGAGNDVLATGSAGDTVDGGDGDDVINTNNGDDLVVFRGAGAGNDNVNLGAGNDVLTTYGSAFTATDSLAGGTGNDRVNLDNRDGPVSAVVNLNNVSSVELYRPIDNDAEPVDALNNFSLTFVGGNVISLNKIDVDASNLVANNDDDGNEAISVDLSGLGDKDYEFSITGGDGDDTVTGSALPENLTYNAGAGNDRLNVDGTDLGSTVTTHGGAGTDTLNIISGQLTDDSFVGVVSYEVARADVPGTGLNAGLGANAQTTGIVSLFGGSGDDNIVIDPLFAPAAGLSVDLSASDPMFDSDDMVNASASAVVVRFSADGSDINADDNLRGGSTDADSFTLRADNGVATLTSTSGVESYVVTENGDAGLTMNFGDSSFGSVASSRISINATALDDTGDDLPEGAVVINAGGVTGTRAFTISTGTGNDNVTTGSGADSISVGAGNNTVSSGAGSDSVSGGDGANVVNTGADSDVVNLGNGNNRVELGSGSDALTAGNGSNTVWGQDGNDNITVGNGNNWVDGGADNDNIVVGNGNNTVFGGTGNDTITAGGTADPMTTNIITGGAGADLLSGGAGRDVFRYVVLSDSDGNAVTPNRDTIVNFQTGRDVIAIETTMLNGKADGVKFAGNAPDFSDAQGAISLTANDGLADYVFQRDTRKLWVDINDDGVLNGLDLQITLQGIDNISNGNVILQDTIAIAAPGIDLLTDSGPTAGLMLDNITNADPSMVRVNLPATNEPGRFAEVGDVVVLTGPTATYSITLTAPDIANGFVDFAGVDLVNGVQSLSARIDDVPFNDPKSAGIQAPTGPNGDTSTLSVTLDQSADSDGTALSVNSQDGVLNSAQSADVTYTFAGVDADAFSTVVTFTNTGNGQTATGFFNPAIGHNHFEANLSGFTVPAAQNTDLAGGRFAVTTTITVIDIANNIAQASDALQIDRTADAGNAATVVPTGGWSTQASVNFAERTAVTMNVTGVDSDAVSVTARFTSGASTVNATLTNAGANTWTLAATNLSGLPDGMVAVVVTITDDVGNVATAGATLDLDTSADADGNAVIVIAPTDRVANAVEVSTVNGTVSGIDADAVSVSVTYTSAGGGAPVTVNAVRDAGTGVWTLLEANLSALGDGAVTATMTVVDDAGNSVTRTATLVKDTVVAPATVAPVTDYNDGTPSGIVNLTEATDAVADFTGTTEAFVAGDDRSAVSVVLNIAGNNRSATVTGSTWSYALTAADVAALGADGAKSVLITYTDSAGNTTTQTANFTLDRVVTPFTMATLAPADGFVNIAEAADAVADLTGGTVEAGSTVSLTLVGATGTITRAATVVGTTWSYTITNADVAALGQGAVTATASATDPAGNTGAAGPTSFTVDTVAPSQPVFSTITDDSFSVFNPAGNGTDTITNDTTLVFSGTAEPNSTVNVLEGVTVVATATANGAGVWTTTPTTVAGNAAGIIHTYTVTATDAAGNTSVASPSRSVTVDTAVTASFAPVGGVDTTINIAEQAAQVTLTGAVEAGSTVSLVVAGNTRAATVSGTTWTYTLTNADYAAMGQGPESVTITATDIAGNQTTATQAFAVDTIAPVLPTITTWGSDTGVLGDGITQDTTIALTGTAEANSTVTIYNGTGTSVLGTTTADGTGNWSFTTAALGDGQYLFNVSATDAAGNESARSATLPVLVDTGIDQPVFGTVFTNPAGNNNLTDDNLTDGFSVDSGVTGDNVTNDTQLLLSGMAEGGATVYISATGTVSGAIGALGQAVADATGAWSFLTPVLTEQTYTFSAFQTDLANNTSAVGAPLTVRLDLTAPAAPVFDAQAISTDSGDSNSDEITNDTTITVSGTVTADATGIQTVRLFRDGIEVGNQVVAANATTWSIAVPGALAQGSYVFTATSTDAANNTSVLSANLPVVIDTTLPTASATLASDTNTGTYATSATSGAFGVADGITDQGNVTILVADPSNSGLSGIAAVTVTIAGPVALPATQFVSQAAAQAAIDAFMDAREAAGTDDGAYTVTVTSSDLAGNTSAPVVTNFTLDTIDPVSGAASLVNDTGITATAQTTDLRSTDVSLTFTVTETNASQRQFSIDAGATWLDSAGYAAATAADATYNVLVRAVDGAGNVSGTQAITVTKDTVAPSINTSLVTDSGASAVDLFTNQGNINIPSILGGDATTLVRIVADGPGAFDFNSGWDTAATVTGLYSTFIDAREAANNDGIYALTVSVADGAGNIGTTTLTFTLKTVADVLTLSITDTLNSAPGTGTNVDGITNNNVVTVSGLSTGAVWTSGLAGGVPATPGVGNTFNMTNDTSFAIGDVVARSTDLAGNVSVIAANGIVWRTDNTAPTTLALDTDATLTGGDNVIDGGEAANFTISGTGADVDGGAGGSRIVVVISDTDVATADITVSTTTAGGGAWSIAGVNISSLTNGNITLTVTEQDRAGNLTAPADTTTLAMNKQLISILSATYDNAQNTLVLTSAVGGFTAAGVTGAGGAVPTSGAGSINFSSLYWDHNNSGNNLSFAALLAGGTAATLDGTGTTLTINLDANAADAIEQNAFYLDGIADRIGVGSDFVFGGPAGPAVEFGGGATGINYDFEGGLAGEVVIGDTGADTLRGGNGSDTLQGGAGADVLTGGNQGDRFNIGSGSSGQTLATADTITDFVTTSDTIDVDVAVTYVEADGAATADFTAFLAAAGVSIGGGTTVYAEFNVAGSGNTWVFVDQNGDGVVDANDSVIVLTGINTGAGIAAGDFV